MQTASHSQQPQAALDWHLLQQSIVVRVLTMGPMLVSPPMMTFSRKADELQQSGAGGAAAATDEKSSCRARWRSSVPLACSPIRVDVVSPGQQQHATTSSRPMCRDFGRALILVAQVELTYRRCARAMRARDTRSRIRIHPRAAQRS